MSSNKGKELLFNAKWISLQEITWVGPDAKERKWETCERTTRKGGIVDAVVIIAILKKVNEPDVIILVKQFRPPVGAYTIETPAGLIDASESPEKAALRELHEETGYVGVVKHISPIVCNDAGMSNANCQVVTIEIDGSDPRNQKPIAANDDGEFIEVLTTPLDGLVDQLKKWSDSGLVISAKLFNFALGMHYQKSFVTK